MMTRYLYCDTETYSPIAIKNGAHAYAEPCEVMLFTYAMDDGNVSCWDITTDAPMPADLKRWLAEPDVVTVWHNSSFDRTVIRHALQIDPPLEHVHDTAVQALTHGLPAGLEILCTIFGVDADSAKLKSGKALIQVFCKPDKKGVRTYPRDLPKQWAEFIEYAKQDIKAMRVIHRKMPMWNYTGRERALWELDQKINDRGFFVDVRLAEAALATVSRAQKVLGAQTREATNNEVQRATQRDAMLQHILKAYGIVMLDMTKSTIEKTLANPDLPPELRALLVLRQQSSTSSTSKYSALLRSVSRDWRLRGSLQFAGAARTARWAGRLFQPQNLPRPKLKVEQIIEAITHIKAGVADFIYDNVMEVLSACVRACIAASHGKKLVVSDLANIEGRMAAWLAGENWKLNAFRIFDTYILDEDGERIWDKKLKDWKRKGPDLYAVAYAKAFNITTDEVIVNKIEGDGMMRQIGKVMELMLQYEGGVGAFLTGAETYRIDLDQMAAGAWLLIPGKVKSQCEILLKWRYEQCLPKGKDGRIAYKDLGSEQRAKVDAKKLEVLMGLSEATFKTCDALKLMWREQHPEISSYWKELERACIRAIRSPGVPVRSRKLVIKMSGSWLRIILPSGRCLCYAAATVKDDKISYMGINQYAKGGSKWQRIPTYGGKLFENVTQAASRDVMGHNMPAIEDEGYATILSVHDELLTETPDLPEYNHTRLSQLLSANPPWAPDLPLAAGGFEGYNYRKD